MHVYDVWMCMHTHMFLCRCICYACACIVCACMYACICICVCVNVCTMCVWVCACVMSFLKLKRWIHRLIFGFTKNKKRSNPLSKLLYKTMPDGKTLLLAFKNCLLKKCWLVSSPQADISLASAFILYLYSTWGWLPLYMKMLTTQGVCVKPSGHQPLLSPYKAEANR